MTITKYLFFFLLTAVPTAESFVPLQQQPLLHVRSLINRRQTAAYAVTTNDDTFGKTVLLDRLQNEYRDLHETIVRDFLAEPVTGSSERELETAVHMAKFYEYQEMEDMDRAQSGIERAHGDIERSRSEEQLAHAEATQAEHQASILVKSMDGPRRRQRFDQTLSEVQRRAHRHELVAKKAELEAQLFEIDSQIRYNDALDLLQQLERKEQDLVTALNNLQGENDDRRDDHEKDKREEQHQLLLKEHGDFLKSIRSKLIAEHDDTRGYEL